MRNINWIYTYSYTAFIKKCTKFGKMSSKNPLLRRFFRILKNIKQRCNNPSASGYKYYGGRGIGCLITVTEIIKLWFRDKAHLMKKPSIDRINNDGHYCLDNCRFIELSENVKKSHIDRKNRKKVINCLKSE